MKKVLSSHNKKVAGTFGVVPANQPNCNCQQKDKCPLPGRCQTKKVVYRATVIDENDNQETYRGLTCRSFKERHYKHKNSFKYKNSENSTTLSTHIWSLKERGSPSTLNGTSLTEPPLLTQLQGNVDCV